MILCQQEIDLVNYFISIFFPFPRLKLFNIGDFIWGWGWVRIPTNSDSTSKKKKKEGYNRYQLPTAFVLF